MGVAPTHPFIDGLPIVNHPAIGIAPFMETPIWSWDVWGL